MSKHVTGNAAALVMGGLLALAVGGCTVGSGSGTASGDIFFLGCKPNGDPYGVPTQLQFFDLEPHFFAGEPFEDPADVAIAQPKNILTIRVQRNGNRIEVNDVLYFNIQNSYEVARCVRGRTINGAPDWDPRMTTSTLTEQPTMTPWCDWSGVPPAVDAGPLDAGPDAGAGGPRAIIHLGTEELLIASLSLKYTCHQAQVAGAAFDGYIIFQDFGGAAQPGVPSDMRDPIPKDFKVNFGDRLRAQFVIILGDQQIVDAIKTIRPIPAPQIGGSLEGYFDFDLERGRAAQPFP